MRKYLLCISTCLLCLLVHAQDSSRHKPLRLFLKAQGGLLAGASGTAPVAQITGGITWDEWRLGIGSGIDWYQYRSIPVIATAERRLPLLHQRLALYASGGLNLPWAAKPGTPWEEPALERAGYYGAAGIAFYLPVSGRHAFAFHLGYTEKTYSLDRSGVFWCPTGNCPERTNIFSYRLRHIGLRAGWSL